MTLHAHVTQESRDCDGRYTSGLVYEPTIDERADDFGDLHFKQRVIGYAINLHAEEGTLAVTPDGAIWHEMTEEGYVRSETRWCEDDCKEASWQRDHSAEAAGY
jgi:hypothetical protein